MRNTNLTPEMQAAIDNEQANCLAPEPIVEMFGNYVGCVELANENNPEAKPRKAVRVLKTHKPECFNIFVPDWVVDTLLGFDKEKLQLGDRINIRFKQIGTRVDEAGNEYLIQRTRVFNQTTGEELIAW